MANNWQKWKSTFLTCHCRQIYRIEAVGLLICNYAYKITTFVNIWNLGQFRENLILCFVSNCLTKVRTYTNVTHIILIIWRTFRVDLIDFHLKLDFPSQSYDFTVKSPNVAMRYLTMFSKKMLLKRAKTFSSLNYRLK